MSCVNRDEIDTNRLSVWLVPGLQTAAQMKPLRSSQMQSVPGHLRHRVLSCLRLLSALELETVAPFLCPDFDSLDLSCLEEAQSRRCITNEALHAIVDNCPALKAVDLTGGVFVLTTCSPWLDRVSDLTCTCGGALRDVLSSRSVSTASSTVLLRLAQCRLQRVGLRNTTLTGFHVLAFASVNLVHLDLGWSSFCRDGSDDMQYYLLRAAAAAPALRYLNISGLHGDPNMLCLTLNALCLHLHTLIIDGAEDTGAIDGGMDASAELHGAAITQLVASAAGDTKSPRPLTYFSAIGGAWLTAVTMQLLMTRNADLQHVLLQGAHAIDDDFCFALADRTTVLREARSSSDARSARILGKEVATGGDQDTSNRECKRDVADIAQALPSSGVVGPVPLRSLNLAETQITDDGVRRLAQAWKGKVCTISPGPLSHTVCMPPDLRDWNCADDKHGQPGDKGLVTVTGMPLQSLNLSWCDDVTAVGIEALLDAVAEGVLETFVLKCSEDIEDRSILKLRRHHQLKYCLLRLIGCSCCAR